jgi:hypothetical protein
MVCFFSFVQHTLVQYHGDGPFRPCSLSNQLQQFVPFYPCTSSPLSFRYSALVNPGAPHQSSSAHSVSVHRSATSWASMGAALCQEWVPNHQPRCNTALPPATPPTTPPATGTAASTPMPTTHTCCTEHSWQGLTITTTTWTRGKESLQELIRRTGFLLASGASVPEY